MKLNNRAIGNSYLRLLAPLFVLINLLCYFDEETNDLHRTTSLCDHRMTPVEPVELVKSDPIRVPDYDKTTDSQSEKSIPQFLRMSRSLSLILSGRKMSWPWRMEMHMAFILG